MTATVAALLTSTLLEPERHLFTVKVAAINTHEFTAWFERRTQGAHVRSTFDFPHVLQVAPLFLNGETVQQCPTCRCARRCASRCCYRVCYRGLRPAIMCSGHHSCRHGSSTWTLMLWFGLMNYIHDVKSHIMLFCLSASALWRSPPLEVLLRW